MTFTTAASLLAVVSRPPLLESAAVCARLPITPGRAAHTGPGSRPPRPLGLSDVSQGRLWGAEWPAVRLSAGDITVSCHYRDLDTPLIDASR